MIVQIDTRNVLFYARTEILPFSQITYSQAYLLNELLSVKLCIQSSTKDLPVIAMRCLKCPSREGKNSPKLQQLPLFSVIITNAAKQTNQDQGLSFRHLASAILLPTCRNVIYFQYVLVSDYSIQPQTWNHRPSTLDKKKFGGSIFLSRVEGRGSRVPCRGLRVTIFFQFFFYKNKNVLLLLFFFN